MRERDNKKNERNKDINRKKKKKKAYNLNH